MRLFVAFNLPAAERQRVFEATSALRSGRFPMRWVAPESLHVTLAFLGEVAEETAERVRDVLHVVGGRHDRMNMALAGVGAFPNLRRPRVVWMGVDGGPAMIETQADAVRSLAPLGFEPEHREWSPHLTLGRAAQRTRSSAFSGLNAVAEAVEYRADVDVDSIDLMRSYLSRGGARYECVERARLRAGIGRTTDRQEAEE